MKKKKTSDTKEAAVKTEETKETAKKPRKRRSGRTNYRPWLKLLVRLLILGAVALLIFLLVRNWRKIMPISFLDWYDTTFGIVEKGENFPYTIDGNAVIDVKEVDPHLVVLDESSVRFFTDDATCVAERSHAYADPTLHTAGDYVLVTEIGGSRFQVETRRGTVLSMAMENRKIYAADLLADGTMAFALNSASQSYLSEVRVLNGDGKSVFEYKSSKYLLCDVALSPNGKKVVAIGTTSEGGMLKSAVLTISLKDGAVTEHVGSEVLLHNVTCFSDTVILAVGDRQVWTLVGEDAKLTKINCDGVMPVGYTATSSLACVALRREGATGAGTAWLFDKSGELVNQVDYTGELRSVSSRENNVLLLTDTDLYDLSTAGVTHTYDTPSDCLFAAFYGEKPMLLTFSELKRPEN